MDFLKSLIIASEKAANIARILRQNDRLLNILTEQKDSSEANPKFHEDFKTLADVLIQEMVRHDVSLKFPEIKTKIEGEENCHFWNRLGEEVNIEIKSSEEETTKMLLNIMDGDKETAAILAAEVHKNISFSEIDTKMPEYDFDINIDELGIWIDPIDGTNEYIKAKEDVKNGEIFLKGLKCVTVLIGVYDKNGVPIIGVINQPFFEKSKRNSYQCHWGVCYQNGNSQIKMSTVNDTCSTNNKIICVSSNENEENLKVLQDGGYTLVSPRGAGYKLLTVIIGLSDAYFLSKPTTYFWDTCAPHAILRALGGNILHLDDILHRQKITVKYESKDRSRTDNYKGILAYRDENVLELLLKLNWTN